MMFSYKYLRSEWASVRKQKTYYLTNLVFSERRTDFCYSVSTLANPCPYGKQNWCYKVLKSTVAWYMNLLTLSHPLQYAKRLVT